MNDKKAPPKPVSNPEHIEVTFSSPCMFDGSEKKKGDKITVTKAQAKHLKSRKLIK